jgi:hypothetical protein
MSAACCSSVKKFSMNFTLMIGIACASYAADGARAAACRGAEAGARLR